MDETLDAADHALMNTVLEASALRKIYRTGEVDVQALRGVDLKLAAGELIVLLGASGSSVSERGG